MILEKPITQKLIRKSLRASASFLGPAAGAVVWSGLAQAASEETGSQLMLLPEHYELMDNGVVVFKLETGENLSLTADQYLILEDGLLLITDELAQASIYSLSVMGSVRAQLLSELEPAATIDGTVAEATPAQTLWITDGQAPRLSEQVELQSYEIAQSSGDDTNNVGDALVMSMAVAPGTMALLGMLMTSDQPDAEVREYLRNWDIRPGRNSSNPMDDAVVFNGALYFGAKGGSTSGKELWKYDGVNAPSIVADIYAGSAESDPEDLVVFNGALYFSADVGSNGRELWKYDGTTATMVTDINPGPPDGLRIDGTYHNLRVYDGALYFAADDGTNGRELWKYDGTTATMVANINFPGSSSSNPSRLTVFDGDLYFLANDGMLGDELWKYDGTTATMVADIYPMSRSSSPYDLAVFNGALYFAAHDGVHGEELWKFDPANTSGGAHGTASLVADINPGVDDGDADNLMVFNNALYFVADNGTNGEELWKYDGVNAPSMVADIYPGADNGVDNGASNILRVYDGALYFGADDGVYGEELWKYDGTSVSRVTDINPGSEGSDLKDFTVFNGVLYFHADNGTDGDELWAYNADGWVV